MTFKTHRTIDLDERDAEILATRQATYTENAECGVQEGEVVIFADGARRYVSHVWHEWTDPETGKHYPTAVQTSDGGSFYLGNGYCSFSGSLYTPVPIDSLTDTGGTDEITAWFFHHDWPQAHNGIDVPLEVRVWTCSLATSETR